MAEENILIFIALIIILAKILADLFIRVGLPPVLAMILIGILFGPTGFNLIRTPHDHLIIHFLAKVGVILLLFMAGLDTDLSRMKKMGGNTFMIALGGVILPFIAGFGISYLFFKSVNVALVFGLILTATSVSVSVMALMDLKKLDSVEGNTILGAAIIDDIIGIVMLTFLFSILGLKQQSLVLSLGKIVGFLVISFAVGIFLIPQILKYARLLKVEKAVVTIVLGVMFAFAWAAEYAEIAAITGAYLTGMFVGRTKLKKRIEGEVLTLGHSLFIALFFVSIGLETNLRLSSKDIIFAGAITIVAVLGKLFGSGLIAWWRGFSWNRSMVIGSGMIPRGEVALIIATIAASPKHGGLINLDYLSAVVFMVIISAFVTPFLLKYFFKLPPQNRLKEER
ncbi:MAG: hypothetical protein APR63_03090 [Desulfuromonas sp. SDB]|nr:MAG: hypothetical protein APR63_03090 [Desulfuromonas sp. SDB]